MFCRLLCLLALLPGLALAQYQKQYPGGVPDTQYGYQDEYHGGGEIRCESKRGGYKECYTGYRQPPQLVRQLSDASCREGSSWGHRPGMVWVSRGCRGVFAELAGYDWGHEGRAEVRCESRDRRHRECRKSFRGPAVVVQQLSDTRCVEGRNWGQGRGVIWVDNGCRAVFAEGYRPSGPHWGGGQGSGYEQFCESRSDRYQRCNWDRSAGIPFLVDQISSAPCVRNRSWGYDLRQGYIWVDHGCRGRFAGR
jgi:hypothetical protein